MNSKRLKYEEILKTSFKEFSKDKDELITVRDCLGAELIHSVGVEINAKISLTEKKINDIVRELNITKQPSIDNLKDLLYMKEKELIYLDMITKSLSMCDNVSSYEYINGLLDNCESGINNLKTKIQLDIDIIKEDINKLVILEALNLKVYDVDAISIVEKDNDTNKERDFNTRDGYFLVCIEDSNILVLVTDDKVDENIKLNIEYERKINYKGRNIYVDIKHNISKEQLSY